MDFGEIGTIAASVTGGGISVGAVVWYLLRSLIGDLKAQVAEMRSEVAHLRDRELADLARRLGKIEDIEANCPGIRLGEQMVNTVGWLKKVDLKLDRIAEDVAGLRAGISSQGLYIGNLDAAHQRTSADLHMHMADRRAHN